MADYKKRVKQALENHHAKIHQADAPRVRRKNSKPEQLVVKAIIEWAKCEGLDLHVVESKAVYSPSAGRYLRSMTSESLSDLVGNYQALAVYVEVKALGRISTLKEHQRSFLARKAKQGCFACVADSVAMVSHHLKTFLSLPDAQRPTYLLQYLQPKDQLVDGTDLF